MRGESWKHWMHIGCLVQTFLFLTASPVAGQFELGPETFVQASGVDISVSGYSVPSFAHWNNDGLKDLIIGEGGTTAKVRVYLNVGTTSNPQFSNQSQYCFYAQSNGSDLTVTGEGCLGCFPRVVQWDSDGKKDLLVGESQGYFKLFLNNSTDADPTFDGGTRLQVGQPGSKADIDVGARATPSVVDWNNDGKKDLIAGAYDGLIRIYINEGDDLAPDFRATAYAQENGGNLDVQNARSSPHALDLDGDGKKDILTGDTYGYLMLYSNVGTDAAPTFSGYDRVESNGVPIDLPGYARSRPFVCEWTGDGYLDVLIGASDGKVHLYQGVPGPIQADFDNDHDVDVNDLAIFQACVTGPTIPYDPESLPQPEGCTLIPDELDIIPADFDADNDVDLKDFGMFQRCFSGEGVFADPDCAE